MPKCFDNKDGCIHERLGSSLSGNSNRRGMEFTGTLTSYKCIGNEDSKTSFASISQAVSDESYSFPNRQYNSLVLSWGGQNRENQKQVFNRIRKKYLLHHGITITTEYLPSSMNVEADWQSRNSKDHSQWKLLPEIFQRMSEKGQTRNGLFTSRLSAQLPRYTAYSQGTDAMQQIWSNQ